MNYTLTDKPEVSEAIANIRMSIREIADHAAPNNDVLQDAQANLEQAIRFLTGEEAPS